MHGGFYCEEDVEEMVEGVGGGGEEETWCFTPTQPEEEEEEAYTRFGIVFCRVYCLSWDFFFYVKYCRQLPWRKASCD